MTAIRPKRNISKNKKTFLINSLLLGILFFTSLFVSAQESTKNGTNSHEPEGILNNKHSINIELLGRTFFMGSLNYEYKILEKFSFGCGVGLIKMIKNNMIRNNNGVEETGKYLGISTTQMINGNYFIGRKKHKMFVTAGLTNLMEYSRTKYPSEKVSKSENYLTWNSGVGYQYSGRKPYVRLTCYVLKLPEPNGWFPSYLPWIGLSTGYNF